MGVMALKIGNFGTWFQSHQPLIIDDSYEVFMIIYPKFYDYTKIWIPLLIPIP